MKDKRTEINGKNRQIEETIQSGRSMYTATELRTMLGDIKQSTKKEYEDVKSRLATAKSDMAD